MTGYDFSIIIHAKAVSNPMKTDWSIHHPGVSPALS